MAIVLPNQPMLLRLARIVGALRRRHEARRELLAEQVLVADVGSDALAVDVERRRRHRAAVEVAERDVHHPREPVESVGNEFAERHQVVLVVAVVAAWHRRRRRPRGRAPSWCSPAPGRPSECRGSRPGPERESARPARSSTASSRSLQQHRDDGLRADDELAARRRDLRRGRLEAAFQVLRRELLLLRHVALQQRDRQGAGRRRVVDPAEQRAGDQGDDQRATRRQPRARAPQRREAEGRGEPGDDRADAVDAERRRQPGERRIDLRVAARDPREAGQEDAARQLGEQPDGGEEQRRAAARARPPARHRRHRRGEVERQERRERQHGERGEPRRQAAVAVHADVHPPGAGTEPADAEDEAERGRAPRRRAADAPGEQRDGDDLQRPEVAGDEGDRLQRAERGEEDELDLRPAQDARGAPRAPTPGASAASSLKRRRTRAPLRRRGSP